MPHKPAAHKLVFFAPSSYFLRGWVGVAGVLLLGAAHLWGFSNTTVFILCVITFFWGGELFVRGALLEAKKLYFGFNAFITLSALGAFGFYVLNNFAHPPFFMVSGDILALPVMFALANFIKAGELRSVNASFAFIESLDNFIARSVTRVEGKKQTRVFAAEVKPGDIILVAPGERISLDCVITKGSALVDEYLLTGNILPAAKQKGAAVWAGCVNKGAAFEARVVSGKNASRLASILKAVKDSERKKLITPSALEAYAAPVLIFFLAVGAAQFAWGLYAGGAARALAVFCLILACAGPVQYMFALLLPARFLLAGARRGGVALAGAQALSALAGATKVFIDKTGTLTTGRLEVSSARAVKGVKEADLLRAALITQQGSGTVFEAALKLHLGKKAKVEKLTSAEVIPAQGAVVKAAKSVYHAGRRAWLLEQKIEIPPSDDQPGRTAFYCAKDGKYLGYVTFSDRLRANAAATVSWLKQSGRQVCLISGDNATALQAAARKAGIEEFYSDMFPLDKAAKIAAQQNLGQHVVMVGDGFNDILALLRADASIAFANKKAGGRGAFGSWVDVYIDHKDFATVRKVFDFNARQNRAARQNILAMVLLNVYALYLLLQANASLPAWALGLLALAAIVIALLNSARLLKI